MQAARTEISSSILSDRRRCLHAILLESSSFISEALSVQAGIPALDLMRTHSLDGLVAKPGSTVRLTGVVVERQESGSTGGLYVSSVRMQYVRRENGLLPG